MDDLFEDVEEFPDDRARERFSQLVGLEHVKERLLKEAQLLLFPDLLNTWSERHYRTIVPATAIFQQRPPLFVFAGDVGTGKTALAETFGDAVARAHATGVRLRRLSLTSRGTGAVGEMTRLLSTAFATVEAEARAMVGSDKRPRGATVLVIDEADALAQSRELDQMHHEDRAGVNALIRGVDRLAVEHLPALIVMCTNRLDALDPAVRRRAAATFPFGRPNAQQRKEVLCRMLAQTGFTELEIERLAAVTGEREDRNYGYTYSDLTQRLLPAAVLDAFPDQPLMFDRLLLVATSIQPTPPFAGEIRQ